MIVQIPAQIYKSEKRGFFKSEKHNSFATFNFGHYQDLSRKPFGSLQILNEEILGPQQRISRVIKEKTNVIILPLFGGIEYKDNFGDSEFLRVEQIRVITADAEMSFEIFNPFENENISYLQIDFQKDKQYFKNYFQQSEVDFTIRNELTPLFEVEKATGFIGIFDGRKEGCYSLKNPENGIFVFIINGAFEVENRLLEAKDGLSMSKVQTIEWEALSENAILLIFEVSLND